METKLSQVTYINPKDVTYYSEKDIAYQLKDKRYQDFYRYDAGYEGIENAIRDRKGFPVDRPLLVRELKKDYQNIGTSASQLENIESLLTDKSYTIVTAHQPSLFTGPLYFIFKICSVIKLSKNLKIRFPEYQFVPVFISGGEDHDFDEINHARIFGKKITWEQDHGGAVGRLNIGAELEKAIGEFTDILGDKGYGQDIKKILNEAFAKSKTYAEFNFHLVNSLFANYGLVVMNMDNQAFKRAFIPYMESEIKERKSEPIILKTQQELEAKGLSSQAFPRPINLFYFYQNQRLRIEYDGEVYTVLGSNIKWNQQEIILELNNNPERFSPNVVMRPLFQETILPNLAYLGGGGEIAYWLERKEQFDAFNVFYPMLIRRDSATIIDKRLQDFLSEYHFSFTEMMPEVDFIINKFIARDSEIDVSLSHEKENILSQIEIISEKATAIDPTISKWISAEIVKTGKLIDQMESRIKRAIKQREEVKINQIRKNKEKLFPQHNLQERKVNFFEFYLKYGPELIDDLIEIFDPFETSMKVIEL